MAGYTNNYGSYDAAEYQSKPNADSTNGTYGTNTPAAQQNRQDYASRANNGGGGLKDPHTAFSEASRNWWPARQPQQPVPSSDTPPTPTAPPTALSNLLREQKTRPSSYPTSPRLPGGIVPPSTPPDQAAQDASAAPPAAQPSTVPVPPAMPPHLPQLPTVIPEVPSLPTAPAGMAPLDSPVVPSPIASTGLASAIRGPAPLSASIDSSADANPVAAPVIQQNPVPVQATPTFAPVFAAASVAPPDAGVTTSPATTPVPAVTTPTSNAPTNPNDLRDPNNTGPDLPPVLPDPGQQRGRASLPGPQWSDKQLGDIYHSGQPFTAAQQAILDQRNPRPQGGTDDPAVAAKWYQGFAFIDPSFANITAADVDNQRTLAVSGKFAAMGHPEWQDIGKWFLAGKPGGQYTPDIPPDTGTNSGYIAPRVDTNYWQLWDAKGLGGQGAPPSASGGQPPLNNNGPATPPGTSSPPGGGQPTTPGATDLVTQERAMYDPLFKQQQSELARTLRAQAALDGSINSGGFNESLGRAESNLSANQGAQLASLTEAERNRQQAMSIAVMQDATQRFGIKTNDDLQRWLNDPNNNTLQKYGIDKNVLLEEYKAQLGLEGSQLSAGAAYSAAALQAATQKAIAEGNNATQLKLGGMQNELGWGQLQGNLYNNDQDRYVAELKMLTDAGISQSTIAAILAAFGPSPPLYTTHP